MARVLDKRVVNPALDVACDTSGNYQAAPLTHGTEIVTRHFETARFGVIDVDADLVVTFSEGLIGFENCREYVVVRHDDNSPFRWLQSLDLPGVAFPIVEPNSFRPDYAPTISDSDARTLNLKRDTPTLLFVTVSVPGHDPRALTANLLAPLVINGEARQGKQVIVQDDGFTTRHEVVKELERTARLAQAPASTAGSVTTSDASSGADTVRAA